MLLDATLENAGNTLVKSMGNHCEHDSDPSTIVCRMFLILYVPLFFSHLYFNDLFLI